MFKVLKYLKLRTGILVALFIFARLTFADIGDQPHFKILHIMSYHSPWRWTDDQFQGFKDGFGVAAVEYSVFQMDTKQNSTEESKVSKAQEAKKIIAQWKPDLVYTSDDDAQKYVASDYTQSSIPFVFSGVNKSPASYRLDAAPNITGVLEREHFVESVKLLQSIAPNIKKLVVVFDDAPMWLPIHKRMLMESAQLKNIEIVAWDTLITFAEFKQKVRDYQTSVDGIVLVGIFNFKDEKGDNVPYQTVLQWVTENSQLPDLSFWIDRVHYGTLAAVSVSGREQGLAAGRMARAILVEGKSPNTIPPISTAKGMPVISLARAKKLKIKIKSSILLASQVIQDFEWEK